MLHVMGVSERAVVSIVVPARNDERRIARCLDSVTGQDVDNVLVVDIGSTDSTPDIVAGFAGVTLVRFPDAGADSWNFAVETIGAGWVVFVGAGERLPESPGLRPWLSAMDDRDTAFAPVLRNLDGGAVTGVPRIVHAASPIRFADPGAGEPVPVAGVDIDFLHDGEAVPGMELVTTTARRSPDTYYRRGLILACERLVDMGDRMRIKSHCDELDELEDYNSPDALYFRAMLALVDGTGSSCDLLRATRMRSDKKLLSNSVIDQSGRHLDALIAAQLAVIRGAREASRYREVCDPWTDVFFDHSIPRAVAG